VRRGATRDARIRDASSGYCVRDREQVALRKRLVEAFDGHGHADRERTHGGAAQRGEVLLLRQAAD